MPERCKGNSKKTHRKPTSFLHGSTPQNRNVNCKCSHPPLTKIHVADGFWYLSQATLSCYALSRPALEMAFHNRGTGPRLDVRIRSSQGGGEVSKFYDGYTVVICNNQNLKESMENLENLENKLATHVIFFRKNICLRAYIDI